MSNEWCSYNLDEVYEFSSGLSKSRKEFGFGYPFVTFKDVFYNFFIPSELTELANTTEKERERCSVNRGDVFLTRTSETMDELGKSSVALKDYESATFNGFTKRLRPKGNIEIYPEYAGYYFRSPRFRAEINSMATMTTRASLNNEMMARLKIVVPNIQEQKAIAKILLDLDEKIEVNNKINKKLEEMSQAIFKQWFVDFEFPNEDGKPYKSSGGEMYESEKGLIPKDFEVSNLGEFFNVITGKENANFAKKNGEYKYFTCSQKDFMCDEFAFDGKALLLAGNGDFSLKWYNGKFNAYQRTYVLQPFKEHTFEYLYLTMNNYLKYITQGSQGSVIKFLTKGMIANYKIIYNDDLVDKFNKIISSIFIKQENINREIEKLSEIRDILLPKLMSGEIRVPMD